MCRCNWLATAVCEYVNRKVTNTAADNNKQGDVQAMEFGIPGYDNLVWDVSLVYDRIGSSMQHGLHGKLQLGDYLNAWARSKIGRYRRDYAVENIAFAPAILSVDGKIHPEFLRLLWVMADMQTVKYFNLVGDEDDIGSERFKWSRASTFSHNRNAIGLAVAYTSALRTHLSVHGTAHHMSAAFVRPRSAADCLICSAVDSDISHPRQQGNPRSGSSITSDLVRGEIFNGLGAGAVGGGGSPSLSPGRATSTVPSSVVSVSIPLSPGRGLYLPTQSQASYRSASSSLSACRPSPCYDVDTKDADARQNVVVADRHADVRASAAMTDDNDDDAYDGDFDVPFREILGTSFMGTHSLDLDLTFSAVDSNVDLALTHPLSPPSPFPPPFASPPSSTNAGEPF